MVLCYNRYLDNEFYTDTDFKMHGIGYRGL